MLGNNADDIDNKKGEKARNLPDRLNYAHLKSVYAADFHGEVVENGAPALKTGYGSHGKYKKEDIHLIVSGHLSPPSSE
jgi:hypothetical protein